MVCETYICAGDGALPHVNKAQREPTVDVPSVRPWPTKLNCVESYLGVILLSLEWSHINVI